MDHQIEPKWNNTQKGFIHSFHLNIDKMNTWVCIWCRFTKSILKGVLIKPDDSHWFLYLFYVLFFNLYECERTIEL